MPLVTRYRRLTDTGQIDTDPVQQSAVEKLQLLANRLALYKPPARTDWLSAFTRRRGEIPQGLYIYGPVGRGKTMLMDLFFHEVPFAAKRRVHFHAFMVEVHEQIALARARVEGDPIPGVAAHLAHDAKLLCFDEFHVTDIADAMILGRLFQALFGLGVVVVATSNSHPSRLYWNGLNRQLFEPFIALLEEKMEVLALDASRDFRLEKLKGASLYFTPDDAAAVEAMQALWQRLTGTSHGEPATLDVRGRPLVIPEAALGAVRVPFDALCEQPLGASDYLEIAQRYHTVFLTHIPPLGPERRNAARRFITLIDTLYDLRRRLVATAATEPDAIYTHGDGVVLFERTVSRLMEMRSEGYVAGA